MRITAEAKQDTRRRILEAARNLYLEYGLERTTTRDLATVAGTAAGTIFNYFLNKEDLGAALLVDAVEASRAVFRGRESVADELLAESLFRLAMCDIKSLRELRPIVGEIIEHAASHTADSMFRAAEASDLEHAMRVFQQGHFILFDEVLRAHDTPAPVSEITLHIYWTLYLGVLRFWSRDASPNQEDTLAMLDQSMRLFAQSLTHVENDDVTHDG